ncbi:MAG: ATP-binding cassette domain-containing protein [Chloroflexi bacterium]|nr:ATP-binding cassette domain-containing protein [Chloroflexota bacterium]
MIHFDRFTYCYPDSRISALRDVQLDIGEGDFVLITGPSGSGKSTLLRCLNGLVPHFSGGRVRGSISVGGHNPVTEGPHTLSCLVGFVFQDPESQFVVDRVEDEIAFALENAAIPVTEMRFRVEEALGLLGITHLRDRSLESLSGGEKQRVAIAAAMALHPRILVLDEPTSQLDPYSADDVLQALVNLNSDLGLTVVLAEHRLERVLPYVDHMVYLPITDLESDQHVPIIEGAPQDVLRQIDLNPPLVELGKAFGWAELPLTIKEGRASVQTMISAVERAVMVSRRSASVDPVRPESSRASSLEVSGLGFSYNGKPVLNDVGLTVGQGELVALMGRNGSGKTTLLKCIVGLLTPQHGDVLLDGRPIVGQSTSDICQGIGYLPQQPDDLLFADSVREELEITLRNHGLMDHPPAPPDELLARLGLSQIGHSYPRDLSVGQRQRVALGAITVTRPQMLLLDEPTRGMDYLAKRDLIKLLREWQAEGTGILLVTHDVELVAGAADRVVILGDGGIIADGSPGKVMISSTLFAPQVARLFPGTGWLTVQDVLEGLGGGVS